MQFNKMFELSHQKKLAIAITWDFLALLVASVFSFWIRLGIASWDISYIESAVILMNIAFALSLLALFGHYKQMVRYIGQKTILLNPIKTMDFIDK